MRSLSTEVSMRWRSGPRSQLAMGTEKPILGRYSTSCGSSGSMAFLKMYLPSPPRSLRWLGKVASHSTSSWSISGSRTSREWAMLARSTLVLMSPTSQVL